MTTTPTTDQAFIDNLKNLVHTLAQDATLNEDPRQRALSTRWLGMMKYDDERAKRVEAPRSEGHEFLHQVASAKLPLIDAFIDTANADQLRHVIEGMVHGLNNHTNLQGPDTTSDPEEVAAFDQDRDVNTLDPRTASLYRQVLLDHMTTDFNQPHDPELRRKVGHDIGRLKHYEEHGLRTWNCTIERNRYLAADAIQTLTAIDKLIATANPDQLRDIITGFTNTFYA